MPTFEEVLADKTKYPDTQKVVLADGVEVELGSLRGGYLRQQDYTQKTQALARERDGIAQERAALQNERAEAEASLTELAKQVVADAQKAGQPVTAEDVEEDPRIKTLKTEIQTLNTKLASVEERQKTQDETLATRDREYYADKHRAMLALLKRHDPELDPEALVDYARQNHIPYLDVAYRAFRFDHILEQKVQTAKAEAEKAGYERGKLEARAPSIPPRKQAGTPSQEAPKTFEEAAEAAVRDPEIIAAMEGLPGA